MSIDITNLDQAKIQQLIDNGVEENIHLDYKACDALKKTDGSKSEVSKDISSFANSDGGMIIYGVIEYDHKPLKIDNGFDPTDISREWLEQVINSRITPKIENADIIPIDLSGSSRCIYVVNIPKSNRAPHQASDRKFYKRYNFESVPMDEYEIRELYHRNIISQAEFRRLQAQVREEIYKPAYSQLLKLKNRIVIEPHPRKIYFDDGQIFLRSVEDESEHIHDFRFWKSLRKGGHWMDIYGIGDKDLLESLDNLATNILKYNSLTADYFPQIENYLANSIGRYTTEGYSASDGWNEIKEEIFANNPMIAGESKTLYYLRYNDREKWKQVRSLPDIELFDSLYSEIMSNFSDAIHTVASCALVIKESVSALVDMLELKIKNTYPTR